MMGEYESMNELESVPSEELLWDKRLLGLALSVGRWSKDRSRQVGAVIIDNSRSILAIGYNGFPRGVDDSSDERHVRPEKYLWTEHAERNAIYDAVRRGVALGGATMYLPWYPCADCARAIIQSGIASLVAFERDSQDAIWDNHFRASSLMLAEAGVRVRLRNKADLV